MTRIFCRNKEGRERGRDSQEKARKVRLFCIRLVICAGIVYCTVYGILYQYAGRLPKDRILHNIYIGNTDVSGMTAAEAEDVLRRQLDENRQKKVTMAVGRRSAEATLEELGVGYRDIGGLVQAAEDYGKVGNLWSRCWKVRRLEKKRVVLGESLTLDYDKAEKVMTERAVPLADHAEDAQIRREEGEFRITPEKKGQTIDIKGSISLIEQLLNEGWDQDAITVKMKEKPEKPSVTAEELEQIQDELGTFSTDAGGGRRWLNLKRGSGMLDGSVLMPGQKLSVHDKTAPYDADHGYVEAGSYEDGQVVDSYGGGICQVSTTLYNAALLAELKVVERHPHSMPVSYIELSRDAAIAGDYMDLVLQNPYDAPVYIESMIDDENRLRFTVYGKETRPAGRKLEFQSETMTAEAYKVIYKENNKEPLGSVVCVSEPHEGKTVRLWKNIYQNGKEIGREKINNSKYEKTDKIVEVGTATADQRAADYVREAIESQEWEKIEEAINAVTMSDIQETEY